MNLSVSDRVADVLRRTLAYAAGVAESDISDETRLLDLGIDSVATMASGVVLEAELEVEFPERDLLRVFGADTVAKAIDIANEIVARQLEKVGAVRTA